MLLHLYEGWQKLLEEWRWWVCRKWRSFPPWVPVWALAPAHKTAARAEDEASGAVGQCFPDVGLISPTGIMLLKWVHQSRQHMVIYQNYKVWYNGLLIFCFAYYLQFNSFKANGGEILALLISCSPKCQMEKMMTCIATVNFFCYPGISCTFKHYKTQEFIYGYLKN